jgi:membrane protein
VTGLTIDAPARGSIAVGWGSDVTVAKRFRFAAWLRRVAGIPVAHMTTHARRTPMARPTGSTSKSAEAQFHGNRAADEPRSGDPAPQTEEISGTRADYAPKGADPKPTTGGTLKRTLKEFSEDNLTDWAAALTYYGVLALFPAIVALLSIIGLIADPKQITDALTAVMPGGAATTIEPVIKQLASSQAAGFGLVIGLALAIWSASGYVGAFTRAANVVYETPEGRKVWKLKPLQLLVTLIGVLFAAVIVTMVVLSGPIVEAVGRGLGLGETALNVWNIAKWPVIVVLVALMIAVLYYATPNVRLRGFKWVSPGAGVALVVWAVASALFAFYVANFGSYNKTYGTLAGMIIFLIWFWLTNVALLFGIELDAEIERTKELKEGVPRAEKEIQLDARAEPKDKQTT